MSGPPDGSGTPGTTRVKVCGMTRAEDVEIAVDAGADAIGLIVDVEKDTPREVSPETAADLAALVPPFVSVVLVTMTDPETAGDLAAEIGADAIQFHGEPDPQGVAALDRRTVVATPPEYPSWARRYVGVSDALLLDSVTETGAGGTGETPDWEAARGIKEGFDTPIVLAGGLNPANVAMGIDAVQPDAVDVATGVESEPGVKDEEAVRVFVGRVKYSAESGML